MEVKINGIGINGEGVGKIQDKVCFVDFCLPEEVVDVDIIENKSKYAIGRVNKVLKTSKNRVETKCPYYYKCGGCHLQHMNSTMQNYFKVRKIADNLHKIAHIDFGVEDIITLNEYLYRNKMVFVFGERDGCYSLGMKEKKSNKFIAINKCLIANDDINMVIKCTNEYLNGGKLKSIAGFKYLVIRAINKQILITFVVKDRINLKGFYEYL